MGLCFVITADVCRYTRCDAVCVCVCACISDRLKKCCLCCFFFSFEQKVLVFVCRFLFFICTFIFVSVLHAFSISFQCSYALFAYLRHIFRSLCLSLIYIVVQRQWKTNNGSSRKMQKFNLWFDWILRFFLQHLPANEREGTGRRRFFCAQKLSSFYFNI